MLVLFTVHPELGTSEAKEQSADLSASMEGYINNARAEALDGLYYIKKVYKLPEGTTVAPKPDPSAYITTTDPSEIRSVIDRAGELLGDSELIWNESTELSPGTEINCYCDDTILVITWKELRAGDVCTFAEIKIADGSQIIRTLAGNGYGSSVRDYATVMSEAANAVVAVSGDFYDFRNMGITVYRRELYRFQPGEVDVCMFTAGGDMLFIYRDEEVTEKGIRQYIEDNDVIFGLSFGPVLVDGGEIVPCSDYPIGEIGLEYTRAAIGVKDELHYLCMIDNKTGGHGSKIDRAAEYMQEKGLQNNLIDLYHMYLPSAVYVGRFDVIAGNINNGCEWALYLQRFFLMLAQMNLGLAVFNLLPVPPLDGYRFLDMFVFKGKLAMERNIMNMIQIAFLVICMSGILSSFLTTVNGAVFGFFSNIVAMII